MTINTGDANISKIRLAEQSGNPATPPNGFGYLYEKNDGGIYFINDSGTVVGPLSSGPTLVTGTTTYLTNVQTIQLQNGLSASVTGSVAFVRGSVGAWVDYSAISTVVGWASFTKKTIFYRIIEGMVFVEAEISGTSDATGASFTLPNVLVNSPALSVAIYQVDAGVAGVTPGRASIGQGSNVVSLGKDMSGGAWTATGTKTVRVRFFYSIA